MVGFPPALDKRVTPDNLYLYPFNRWTLQSTRRFTRTASTLTERKDVHPIPEKLDSALLNTNLTINGADHTVATMRDRTFTDALVVVKDGNLVAEWYGNGMTASKPHYISSVTKGVTGLLAELLIAQGRLDESRPVKSYIPELTHSPFGDATVRDVLGHESQCWRRRNEGRVRCGGQCPMVDFGVERQSIRLRNPGEGQSGRPERRKFPLCVDDDRGCRMGHHTSSRRDLRATGQRSAVV